mmetsp:Transcript_37046/g.48687  ORF Transcript_37046/g.48687 Transcript_37046/m.48687 type:complete len:150 (+) Transcript_37046:187-636(+)
MQAGFGFCYIIGLKKSEIHDTLPILLLGIGVDDMFVLCNAMDQTSLKKKPEIRLREAMRHAGPSITITSVTNALAFLSGSLTTIPAIHSFCIFCTISVTTLYLIMLTIFVPVYFWDTKRVANRRRECCGLCFCAEDSIFCCMGRCLSPP